MIKLAALAAMVLALQAPAPSFHQVFDDEFNTTVKLGAFSGCDSEGSNDTPHALCTGLSGATRSNWWAYPLGWPDTATQRGYKVGGIYHPEQTVWISGGEMHIKMYHSADGHNHVATVVPKGGMGMTFGKFEIRERVSHVGVGFKTADLRWPVTNGTCSETDFPELEHDAHPTGFYHPTDCSSQLSFPTSYKWTTWHTYDMEETKNGTSFWVDGKKIGSTRQYINTPQDWDIQNESALNGESSTLGSWDQVDIAYVKIWKWS